jgi:hypothetical protein
MAHVGSSPSRPELVRRRYAKGGWVAVAAGVVIPFLAFSGAYRGFRLWRAGCGNIGLPLLVVGSAVFVLRLGLWASTGFHSAW